MRIHFIMHESFEGPAAIQQWAVNRGYDISYSKLYQMEKLPDNIGQIDFLIVMGGPQSPATTMQDCSYFDAEEEINLIKEAIAKEKLVLGVCLGAQLIGEACGARFEHSPNKEIGIFPIHLTEEAKHDPIFAGFPETFPVGHWHGDMPGVSDKSVILAYSEGCPRQIVKYSPKVYGFQCHFEFNQEAIENMIQNSAHELERYKDLPYVQNAKELKKYDYNAMNQLLFNFLDQFVASTSR